MILNGNPRAHGLRNVHHFIGTAIPTLALLLTPLLGVAPASAAEVIPDTPDPVAVTLDPSTTAFLIGDMISPTCPNRPTCAASIPAIADLRDRARAAGVFVLYSRITPSEIVPELTPADDEPVLERGGISDLFFATNIDDLLKAHGIQTLVMVGTSAIGIILYSSFEANARGYTVVVADDAISANLTFQIQLARYQLLNQPGLGQFNNANNTPLQPLAVTLSRTDLISFEAMAPGEAM
jgi:nicotinamidase-related amidase